MYYSLLCISVTFNVFAVSEIACTLKVELAEVETVVTSTVL